MSEAVWGIDDGLPGSRGAFGDSAFSEASDELLSVGLRKMLFLDGDAIVVDVDADADADDDNMMTVKMQMVVMMLMLVKYYEAVKPWWRKEGSAQDTWYFLGKRVRSLKVAKEPHHRPIDVADSWRTVRIMVSRCLFQFQFSGEIF